MLHELGVKTDHILGEVKEVKTDLRDMKRQNATLLTSVGELKQQTETIAATTQQMGVLLTTSTGRSVAQSAHVVLPPDNAAKGNALVVLALTATKYTVLRVQVKAIAATLLKHRTTHPDLRVVLSLYDVPNAINLWTRCREVLDGMIKTVAPTHTTFTRGRIATAGGTRAATEADVIAAVRKVRAEPVKQAEAERGHTKTEADGQQLVAIAAELAAIRTATAACAITFHFDDNFDAELAAFLA
jgi:hypothetical protein